MQFSFVVLLTTVLAMPALANRETHEAFGSKVMIASQGSGTSAAGMEVAKAGGNAIDIAVALSFAISVERPHSTGIGGGGFLLFHSAKTGKVIAFDFREKAPLAAYKTMYQDKDGNVVPNLSTKGALAAGVPGLVDGLVQIHKQYGKLPLKTVMQPAIRLARDGFPVYPEFQKAIEALKPAIEQNDAAKALLLTDKNEVPEVGSIFLQKDLAKTLTAIATHGRDGFYKGWVADALVRDQKKLGGMITQTDLDQYNTIAREPVAGTFNGYQIYSMPPPSSGGIHVIQMLNVLEQYDLGAIGFQNTKYTHILAQTMQQAFADRAEFLGDADFVSVPMEKLTSKTYGKRIAAQINPKTAPKSETIRFGDLKKIKESDETTHFSVMDIEGNVVSSTQTINGWLGAVVVVPGTGIILNNEMDDFVSKPGVANLFGALGGEQNAIQAKKRPLSSMSPTIVMKDGAPVLALGSPSGTRIISCVLQTLVNRLAFKFPLYEAVAARRIHHQWSPDEIRFGPPAFAKSQQDQLQKLGWKLNEKPLGCKVQAVEKTGNRLHGVSDPRGEGSAAGY